MASAASLLRRLWVGKGAFSRQKPWRSCSMVALAPGGVWQSITAREVQIAGMFFGIAVYGKQQIR